MSTPTIQYCFGVATLALAVLGLLGTYVSSVWSGIGAPREQTSGAFLVDGAHVSRDVAAIANRQRLQIMSLTSARAANLTLFASVVTALVINFPWLWRAGIAMTALSLIGVFLQVRSDFKEILLARKAFEVRRSQHKQHYDETLPDDFGLKKRGR